MKMSESEERNLNIVRHRYHTGKLEAVVELLCLLKCLTFVKSLATSLIPLGLWQKRFEDVLVNCKINIFKCMKTICISKIRIQFALINKR